MSGASLSFAQRIAALRDEHCYIISTDVCGYCGDCECDGIACISCLDPDHYEQDFEAIENLHDLLRSGQAWRVMQTLLDVGEEPLVAVMLADEALAVANNQTVTTDCEHCGLGFPAQTPCDTICTTCRLTEAAHPGSSGGSDV